jgi:hypothetical protein
MAAFCSAWLRCVHGQRPDEQLRTNSHDHLPYPIYETSLSCQPATPITGSTFEMQH